jgi:hypothetical protein
VLLCMGKAPHLVKSCATGEIYENLYWNA